MNWAWGLTLSPRAKLVLMSLADAADDQGVCWPSIPTVARKCCLSKRTIQRTLQDLVNGGWLQVEPRFRKDGSRTSNSYRLALEGGDRLARAPDKGDTGPVTPVTRARVTTDTPRTTKGTINESPRLPEPARSTEPASCDGDPRSSRQEIKELIYPEALSREEQAAAEKLLTAFPSAMAQQLLDELTGRMASGSIRLAPINYLRGLVREARAERFTPTLALKVGATRRQREKNAAALRRAELDQLKILETRSGHEDSALAKKLRTIRDRHKGNLNGKQ